MIKLKYRLIKALATLLRCEYIIDQDEYDSVVPRVKKAYSGKIPDGLLPTDDIFNKPSEWYIFMSKNVHNHSYVETFKNMSNTIIDKPSEHYEEPTNKVSYGAYCHYKTIACRVLRTPLGGQPYYEIMPLDYRDNIDKGSGMSKLLTTEEFNNEVTLDTNV